PQLLFGLLGGESLHPHRKPPRGGEPDELAVSETRLVETGADRLDERLLKAEERLRRQLLGADLEEEIPRGLRTCRPRRGAGARRALACRARRRLRALRGLAPLHAAAPFFGFSFRSGKPSFSRLSR